MAETCQLVQFDPTLLSCARSAVSSLGEEVAQREPLKGFPLDAFGNKRAAALLRSRGVEVSTTCPMGQSSTGFGSTLFLACKHFLVCKMTNDFPAEQQIWKTCSPQGIFALQKSLRRASMGDGALIAEGKVPAQRNFQRKFALRRVGSAKFVVPPTTERSKVRSTPNRYNRLYRAARVAEGPRPSVSEGVQRKPFPRVSFGQFLRRGSTRRFFAQLRSVGSNHQAGRLLPVEPGACATARSKKTAPAGTAKFKLIA